jgi:amino acid transporter
VWVACGVASIFGAIAYAGMNFPKKFKFMLMFNRVLNETQKHIELGCMIPKAGGEYEYLKFQFGDLYGFLFIWTFIIIIIPASFALTALTFADYVLQPVFTSCEAPLEARLLLAASAICKFNNSSGHLPIVRFKNILFFGIVVK